MKNFTMSTSMHSYSFVMFYIVYCQRWVCAPLPTIIDLCLCNIKFFSHVVLVIITPSRYSWSVSQVSSIGKWKRIHHHNRDYTTHKHYYFSPWSLVTSLKENVKVKVNSYKKFLQSIVPKLYNVFESKTRNKKEGIMLYLLGN